MAPYKVQIIQGWPKPWKGKDVPSFLSFTNFYHHFIYGYSEITIQLMCLTQKGTFGNFSNECHSAFKALKKALTTALLLTHWIPDIQITVKTDWYLRLCTCQSFWSQPQMVNCIQKLQKSEEFFGMHIIVILAQKKSWSGMQWGAVHHLGFVIKRTGKCIVWGINQSWLWFECQGSQWVRSRAVVKAFLSALKAEWHSLEKLPKGTLLGKTHEAEWWFQSIHKWNDGRSWWSWGMMEHPCLSGFGPTLDNLDLVWGHGEAFRWQHIPEVFSGSYMKLAFICIGKEAISMESVEYFPYKDFVLGCCWSRWGCHPGKWW